MKSKVVYAVIVLITISITGYGVYTAQKSNITLSSLNLVNTEILANAENPSDFWIPCYSYVSCSSSGERRFEVYCGACAIPIECTVVWGQTTCTLFW